MEYEDPHRRQATWPPRSMFNVASSRDASDRCWPITREQKVSEIPKLVGRFPRAIMRTSFKGKGQMSRSRSPGQLMLRPEVCHIFWRKGLRTSNLVHRWRTKTRIILSAMTSKVKGQGRDSTRWVWQMLTHKWRTKSPRNTKIGTKVAHSTGNNEHHFKVIRYKGKGKGKGKGKAYLYSAFNETSPQGAQVWIIQGCPCKLHHTCLYLTNVHQMAPPE